MIVAMRLLSSLAALALVGCVASEARGEVCDLTFSNGVELRGVPVAKTVAAQAQGLSGVDDVGPGMLFSWDAPELRVFWMKDTRVPLSIGFFDADGELFDLQDMTPMSERHHFSAGPASAALELRQGEFQRLDLMPGIRLTHRDCQPAA